MNAADALRLTDPDVWRGESRMTDDETSRILSALLDLYAGSPPEERRAMEREIRIRHVRTLRWFSRRAAEEAVAFRSEHWLLLSVLALVLAGLVSRGHGGVRIIGAGLVLPWHSALVLGVDPRRVFDQAAVVATKLTQSRLADFVADQAEHDLDHWGWRVDESSGELRYLARRYEG